jgi:hypothetical protein
VNVLNAYYSDVMRDLVIWMEWDGVAAAMRGLILQ